MNAREWELITKNRRRETRTPSRGFIADCPGYQAIAASPRFFSIPTCGLAGLLPENQGDFPACCFFRYWVEFGMRRSLPPWLQAEFYLTMPVTICI
jgi:hypothetical protein